MHPHAGDIRHGYGQRSPFKSFWDGRFVCLAGMRGGYAVSCIYKLESSTSALGGRNMLLGTSPIAWVSQEGLTESLFALDMAPTIAARGKMYKAQRRGESIPDDWALDKHGNRTTDPSAALEGGVLLPVGGLKGSALAIMMDVVSGVFSGSAFAGDEIGPYHLDGKANVGSELFMSTEDFKARMDTLYQRVVECEKMQGTDRIYFPGEIETIKSRGRKVNGITYATTEIETLKSRQQI